MSSEDEKASASRPFRRFIGINLGGGRGKTTAIARVELGAEGQVAHLVEARLRHGHRGGGEASPSDGDPLFRDDVLIAYVERWLDEATVVAINAPLTLPACIRCQLVCPGIGACEVPVVAWMRRHGPSLLGRRGRGDPHKPVVTPYTQRAVDLLLSHEELHPRESLGQGMGPLAARAAYLRRALSPRLRLHENLIEVHPPATLARLLGGSIERGLRQGEDERIWSLRKDVLGRLGELLRFDYVWPEVVVRSPHIFDAVIAAYTGFLWAKQGWQGPRDLIGGGAAGALEAAIEGLDLLWLEDGWIWVPPRRGQTSV